MGQLWYSRCRMRSAAFRVTIGAAAWIAIGVAALLLVRSERQIRDLADGVRAFDRYAREAADSLIDGRMAQQAYVAAGQGTAYWLDKASISAAALDAALASLRASASPAAIDAIDEATRIAKDFAAIDARVREYLKSAQT